VHAGVRARKDRRRRFSTELVQGEARVIPRAQKWLAIFDERPNERPELVEGGTFALNMLLESKRQLGAFLELTPEDDERPEDEPAQGRVEMRRTYGHLSPYATNRPPPLSAPVASGFETVA